MQQMQSLLELGTACGRLLRAPASGKGDAAARVGNAQVTRPCPAWGWPSPRGARSLPGNRAVIGRQQNAGDRGLRAAWFLLIAALMTLTTTRAGGGEVARWSSTLDVTAIAQTPDGFLWVAGEASLRRFDGVDWMDEGEPKGGVDALLVDPAGGLWVAQQQRLLRQDARGRRDVGVIGDGSAWPKAIVRRLRWIDDALHVAASSGVFRFEPGRGLVSLPGLETAGGAFDLIRTSPAGPLLAATLDGLLAWQDGQWRPHPRAPPQALLTSLASDADGTLWMGGRSLASLAPDGALGQASAEVVNVRSLAFIDNGELWVGTHADGVFIRDQDGRWRPGHRRLRGETVTSIMQDREGNVGSAPSVPGCIASPSVRWK